MTKPAAPFVGPSLTPGYRPRVMAGPAAGWLHDQPWFTWWEVEAMRRDPQILFGLSILRAPLDQAKWEIEADSPEVEAWVERTLRRFWDRELDKAARNLEYGSAAGEVLWRYDEERDSVEFDRLKELTVFDARPLESGGKLWGLEVSGVRGGKGAGKARLPAPRFFWSAVDPEIGRFHGRSRLAGPWAPWMEKTARHGAIDSRRQWFLKCAYDGGVMYHPVGTIETAPGVFSTCQDYAREILEKKENGGMLALPNVEAEEGGKKLWEHQSPKINGSGKELIEYPKTLDEEILVGMGIPLEVARASESGSGWSGRSIPFIVYLTGEDRVAKAIFHPVDECILKPGVEANFGPGVKYGVKLKSFVPDPQEAPDKSQGQGGGGQPPPPQQPPDQPRPGGMTQPVRMSAAPDSASRLVDAMIARGAAAGVTISDEVRRRVRRLVKKKYPAKP